MTTEHSQSGRVTIKLQSSTSLSKYGKQARLESNSCHGAKRHRARELNDDDGSQSEDDDDSHHGRSESVSVYGSKGSSHDDRPRSRADRRSERQGRTEASKLDGRTQHQLGRPEDVGAADEVAKENTPVQFGLTIKKKESSGPARENGQSVSRGGCRSGKDDAKPRSEVASKSPGEEAMDALLRESKGATKKRKYDVSTDPDREPGEEDYRAIPVDDFGATLLRKFGWDGKMRGKVMDVQRHANLTGLGARNVKGAEDLGAWEVRNAKGKEGRRPRLDEHRREEEKKRQKMDERYGEHSYKRDRERERDRSRDRDGSRH